MTELAIDVDAARDPLARLESLENLQQRAIFLRIAAVEEARRGGASWASIGRALGVSRQAAHAKFGQRGTPAQAAPLAAPEAPDARRTDEARRRWDVMSPRGRVLLRVLERRREPFKRAPQSRIG